MSITNTKGTNFLSVNEGQNYWTVSRMQKKHSKPVTIRAAMLGESKGNSELCSNEPFKR